jgi:aryl-alcohol dehydrogenase-like predicted oxidoreductase
MEYGNVPGLDKPVSRIVQGMMQVDSKDEAKGFALLDAVWKQGCRAFDTARVYGDKDSFLGKWINARGIRDQAVVLAKGAHHNNLRRRVTPFDIAADLHDTLAAMQFDYVDLYVLHRDDPDYPVGPIVETLNQYVREGKIRAFGGSNWSVERLAEANEYARANGLIPFACSSPNYSLAEQQKEPWSGCVSISGPQGENARRWYAEQKMPLFTWSSMAGGFWSERFTRDNLGEFTSGLDKVCAETYGFEPNFQRLERVRELARAKNVTVPQIALSYVVNDPDLNVFALVGAAKPEEFADNLHALGLKLSDRERAYIDLRADTPA